MKITFNINNINKRLNNLLDWLRAEKPDGGALQELKAADKEFPKAAIEQAGFGAAWRGQKSWNGVAILARDCEPVVTRTELPGDGADTQARYIEAAVNGVIITSIYAPNGNPQPGPKFDYKLAWLERLAAHAAELYAAGVPVVLAGDYNVVPTERDIYPSRSHSDNALVQPESRAAFARILEQGWLDAIRSLHPDAPMYTFWDCLRNRWPRDAGLRLDHLLLSRETAQRLAAAGVDRDVRGQDNASDHAPAWIELNDAKTRRPSARSSPKAAPKPRPSARARKVDAPRRPLLVIDGDSFAHRSHHALPKTILARGGKGGGAILGFANFLLRIYQAEQPLAVLVGWDTLDAPTYRHRQFPAYQRGREFDDALIEQLDVLPELVAACGFANAKAAGYEADDFVASAAATEERRGGSVLVASGDRDSYQLASERTTILYPVRAGEMARIGPTEVRERYGVEPAQVPDFIALRGDPSDKLPGAPGVGAKGAADLIRKYGSLEGLLAAGRFSAHADALRVYRSIATMDRKAPLPPLRDQRPSWEKASALARSWDLNQLADRLATLAKAKPD
jgi:exodeoxyribonuclease III